MNRVGDLELTQDLAFEEREWKWERVGLLVLLAVVALAAAGLFGHGPVSWTSASSDDGSLEVTFERFGRRGGSHGLVIEAAASTSREGAWEVEVSRDYSSAMEVESVTPTPEAVASTDDGVRYTFSQVEPGADLEATFSLEPEALWSRSGEIRVGDGQPVGVHQFLFP